MLILRDAFLGLGRFDEFEKSLRIAPTMLTRRLQELVDVELLEKRRYCDKPPRYEYVLTARGRDFWPVLVTLLDWGNRHFAPEGASVVLVNRATGKRVRPALKEASTGQPITSSNHVLGPGPMASEIVRRRMAFGAAKHEDPTLRPTFLFD
jgi:DNA-binding HxlR family transcriptional regulator